MATVQERLNEWLRDAHATAEQAATVFSGTAKRNDDYPEFSERLQRHGALHQRQAERLEQCLEQRGAGTSFIKDTTGQITAVGQTLSGLVVGDEVVKAALATSTFAQMEVSSYKILVAAAQQAGDPTTRQTCEEILAEEEEFADWLEGQLPQLTAQYLQRETTAAPIGR